MVLRINRQILSLGDLWPYSKPNNTLRYINVESNHPPAVIKNIPEGINRRLSEISSNEEIFESAAPEYQKALNDGGHPYRLHYKKPKTTGSHKRTRKRKIIWYNPPYNKNVKTNVGKEFLKIIGRAQQRAQHQIASTKYSTKTPSSNIAACQI